jgi:hypothetical protein
VFGSVAGHADAAVQGGGYFGAGSGGDNDDGMAPGSMGRAYLYWWLASVAVLAIGFKIVDGY